MSAFNQLNVMHSLRTYLATTIGIPAIWVYDGVTLPTAKPFITVEQMQNNATRRDKMREVVETIYRFQVGLRANTASERARQQERIENALDFATIPLLDADGANARVGVFDAVLTGVVPMGAEDNAAVSDYHRVYFDVEISGYKYRK